MPLWATVATVATGAARPSVASTIGFHDDARSDSECRLRGPPSGHGPVRGATVELPAPGGPANGRAVLPGTRYARVRLPRVHPGGHRLPDPERKRPADEPSARGNAGHLPLGRGPGHRRDHEGARDLS